MVGGLVYRGKAWHRDRHGSLCRGSSLGEGFANCRLPGKDDSTPVRQAFCKNNKNDANDAMAICEAMARPNMYSVSIKTVEQQDIQAIHRVREEIKTHRTAKANQMRGLVAEYGLVAPKELAALRRAVPQWLEDGANGLNPVFQATAGRAME
jgi:hypothetical protein